MGRHEKILGLRERNLYGNLSVFVWLIKPFEKHLNVETLPLFLFMMLSMFFTFFIPSHVSGCTYLNFSVHLPLLFSFISNHFSCKIFSLVKTPFFDADFLWKVNSSSLFSYIYFFISIVSLLQYILEIPFQNNHNQNKGSNKRFHFTEFFCNLIIWKIYDRYILDEFS